MLELYPMSPADVFRGPPPPTPLFNVDPLPLRVQELSVENDAGDLNNEKGRGRIN